MYSMDLFNALTLKDITEIRDFRKERFEKFNSLPLPVWKRVGLRNFELPEYREYGLKFIDSEGKEIEVRDIREGENLGENLKNYVRIEEPFGVAEKFVSLGESLYNAGVFVRARRNIKSDEVVRIDYRLDEGNPVLIDHNIIVAEENSRMTLVMDYTTENSSEVKAFHNGITKVYAKRGAEINIIKVQRMHKNAYHFDSNIALLEGEARVNWISIEIGGSISATSYVNELIGTASEANIKSVYLGDGDSRIDLGYTMNHRGMRSQSNIETRGALKDNAKKVFRGNLDFKRGARRSKGSEEEYVLLLSPNVKSDAIPVLFCGEDDVEGNHAASAGQIDEEKLFYLMSRGIEEREAKKLIVEASFRPILDNIPIDELRESIEENIHRRLVYA